VNLRHLRILWVLAVNGYWFVQQVRVVGPAVASDNPTVNIWFGGNTGGGSPILIWEPVVLLIGIGLAFAAPKMATWVNCAYYFGVGAYIFYEYSQQMIQLAASAPTRSVITAAAYLAIGLITFAFGFEAKAESRPVDLSKHW
jgi:hypothetical protein